MGTSVLQQCKLLVGRWVERPVDIKRPTEVGEPSAVGQVGGGQNEEEMDMRWADRA